MFRTTHKTDIFYFDQAFTDRVLVQGNYTQVTFSIENSTRNDSGNYHVEIFVTGVRRCFTVYILGEYFYLYRISNTARKKRNIGETGASSASGHVRHMAIFSM